MVIIVVIRNKHVCGWCIVLTQSYTTFRTCQVFQPDEFIGLGMKKERKGKKRTCATPLFAMNRPFAIVRIIRKVYTLWTEKSWTCLLSVVVWEIPEVLKQKQVFKKEQESIWWTDSPPGMGAIIRLEYLRVSFQEPWRSSVHHITGPLPTPRYPTPWLFVTLTASRADDNTSHGIADRRFVEA